MGKVLGCLGVFILIVVIGGFAAYHLMGKAMVLGYETMVSEGTGFTVDSDSADASSVGMSYNATGVTVANPADYPVSDFIEAREVGIDFHLNSDEQKVQLEALVLDVSTLALVTDPATGRTNLNAFINSLVDFGDDFNGGYSTELEKEGVEVQSGMDVLSAHVRLDKVIRVEEGQSLAEGEVIDISFEKTYTDAQLSEVVEDLAKQLPFFEFERIAPEPLEAPAIGTPGEATPPEAPIAPGEPAPAVP